MPIDQFLNINLKSIDFFYHQNHLFFFIFAADKLN
jgi:hypothetical protein